jgi:hypothetical protein
MIGIVFVLSLGCLLFAGCSETVILRHSKTGATVTCGPYFYFGYRTAMAQCVTNYQRQGFERIPN